MTLQEFKAWFEGFTEDMAAAPNKKQWERIKKRVKEIDGSVTTYPVFVDQYWPHYPRYWNTFTTCNTLQGAAAAQWQAASNLDTPDLGRSFNSAQAMIALGKADYQTI